MVLEDCAVEDGESRFAEIGDGLEGRVASEDETGQETLLDLTEFFSEGEAA